MFCSSSATANGVLNIEKKTRLRAPLAQTSNATSHFPFTAIAGEVSWLDEANKMFFDKHIHHIY